MPATTITVNREQRDGLYELVRNHLGSVGDLFDALERDKDFAKAARLGLKLVLAHMRQHKGETPHTASAIGKVIERSSRAVANCLGRLEKQEKVRLAKPKPRSYALAEAKRQ